jgi:hypothetical protein
MIINGSMDCHLIFDLLERGIALLVNGNKRPGSVLHNGTRKTDQWNILLPTCCLNI